METPRTADNVLTRLWNSYRKEHPDAERPPKSLIEKAKGIEQGKGKAPEDKKPDPKPKGDEVKNAPDKKLEDRAKKVMQESGFTGTDDITKALDSMLTSRKTLSKTDRESPAGKHHLKRMNALSVAMAAGDKYNAVFKKVITEDGDLNDPKVKAEMAKHTKSTLDALDKFNALGDAPPKGMTEKIKGLLSGVKGMADKLKSRIQGKKAMVALMSRPAGRTASGSDTLVRKMIRVAHADPNIRAHLLPIIVEHLAGSAE